MKRMLASAAVAGLLLAGAASCSNMEKKAQAKLQEARTAFERNDFETAKLLIDSIKLLYPKAYDTRHESLRLQQEVDLGQQRRTVAYLDSVLEAKGREMETLRKECVLEKDSEYQSMGRYLAPSQVIEKNLQRSYLRFQTDEQGNLSMTSIYCGGKSIHHTSVRVTAPDGSSAQTPVSTDSYETTDLGRYIEKADYAAGHDGGVIEFVCQNAGKNLKVSYEGGSSYATTMSEADRKAAVKMVQLSEQLAAMAQLNKAKEEALTRIRFVERKMAERAAADNAGE